MGHRFKGEEFWREIPAWKDVDYKTFVDHRWQEKNAITNHKKLLNTIQDLVNEDNMQKVWDLLRFIENGESDIWENETSLTN